MAVTDIDISASAVVSTATSRSWVLT